MEYIVHDSGLILGIVWLSYMAFHVKDVFVIFHNLYHVSLIIRRNLNVDPGFFYHCGTVMPYEDIELGHICSGIGLLLDGTKPLLEPILIYCQEVQWHSSEGNYTRDTSAISTKISLKVTYLRCHSNAQGLMN